MTSRRDGWQAYKPAVAALCDGVSGMVVMAELLYGHTGAALTVAGQQALAFYSDPGGCCLWDYRGRAFPAKIESDHGAGPCIYACGATENQDRLTVWRLPRSAEKRRRRGVSPPCRAVGLVCRAGGRPSPRTNRLLAVMDAMKMEHTIDTG
jgi:hypothetical protein